MNRIVIDADPSVDDAHAILMACAHPETEVVALTIVAGNVSLEKATQNALKILDVVRKDIPVYAGCEDALVVPTLRCAISHGVDGLGDSGYPPPSRRAEWEHAVQALIRLANEHPGELTRGQTVFDWEHLTSKPLNTKIVLEIDRECFWGLMKHSLG